jgi:hypothetical protein
VSACALAVHSSRSRVAQAIMSLDMEPLARLN